MDNLLKNYYIPNTNLTLQGYSKAADSTGFYINELDVGLDAGYKFNKIPKHLFISHTHCDHCRVCCDYCIESNKIEYFIPAPSLTFLENFINCSIQLNKNKYVSNKYLKIYPVKENQQLKLNLNNHTYLITIIKCDHGIPTVGYCFTEIRKKLKKEYKDLNQQEIISLKKNGTDITEEEQFPKFIFVGDTTIKFFDDNPGILNKDYKSIIIECTFIYEEDYPKLQEKDSKGELKYKHIHWNDLKEYVINNPQIHFILIHFSTRYKDEEIKEFFQKENINNLTPWI